MTPEEIIARTIEDFPDEGVTNAEAAIRIVAALRAKGLQIVGTGAKLPKPTPPPTIPDPYTPLGPLPWGPVPAAPLPQGRGPRCPNEGRPCFCTGVCLRPPPVGKTWTTNKIDFDDPADEIPLG